MTEIALSGGQPVDPETGVPLSLNETFFRTEALRSRLRDQYRTLVGAGYSDRAAREELAADLALLLALDRLEGAEGDPLSDTSEADYT